MVGTGLDPVSGSGEAMECLMEATEPTGATAIPCSGDGGEAEAIRILSAGTSRGYRGGGGQCQDIPATGLTPTVAMLGACRRPLTDILNGHRASGSIQRLHSRVSSKPDSGMGSVSW